MIIMGVDPGITGAIGVLDTNWGESCIIDIPTKNDINGKTVVDAVCLCQRLNNYANQKPIIYIERVHAMPGQGAVSTFNFGRTYGTTIAVLEMISGVHYVTPQTWKKYYRLGADKDQCRQVAMNLYPAFEVILKRKKDHNRAEALLIANWAYETIVSKGGV